jgi:hypothetical protein
MIQQVSFCFFNKVNMLLNSAVDETGDTVTVSGLVETFQPVLLLRLA